MSIVGMFYEGDKTKGTDTLLLSLTPNILAFTKCHQPSIIVLIHLSLNLLPFHNYKTIMFFTRFEINLENNNKTKVS